MTLRATIDIVPFDDESATRKIFEMEISQIDKLGGNDRRYRARLFEPKNGQMEQVGMMTLDHNRSDGALALVSQVAKGFSEGGFK